MGPKKIISKTRRCNRAQTTIFCFILRQEDDDDVFPEIINLFT